MEQYDFPLGVHVTPTLDPSMAFYPLALPGVTLGRAGYFSGWMGGEVKSTPYAFISEIIDRSLQKTEK